MAKKSYYLNLKMKPWNKIGHALSILALAATLGCNKATVIKNNATILGADYRMCASCGGWFIEIERDTFRFFEVPSNSNVDLNSASFPLQVDAKWRELEDECMNDLIEVTSLKRG